LKVLFLSQRVPYPPNRGDKITTWRLVERMGREHEVACVAFAHDAEDARAARELGALGYPTHAFPHRARLRRLASLPLLLTSTPLTLGVFASRELQARVDGLARWADVAYAYSSSMGAFLLRHAIPWVMHFAELDSDKWRQYGEATRFPLSWVYRREARTLLELERRLARAARTSVFCTPLEEAIFRREIPGRPSTVLRNGVDLEHFRPAPGSAEPRHVVFTGVMDYYPNVDACVSFAREVLPRLREEFADARFTIVGARPNAEVRRLAALPGVTVTGFVDDTREWLARAAVGVAPLRIARGIQNKVLEALAMGLPVVGTTVAVQGVEGRAGEHYLVADGSAALADAVARLFRDPQAARELGARGRRFVEGAYDWEVAFAPLDGILRSLLPSQSETTRA